MSKTAKGLAEATGKTSQLPRAQRNLLKGINGRIPIADLAEKFTKIPEAELLETLQALEQQGFVRKLPGAGAAAPASAAKGEAARENVSDEGEDLDFTAIADAPAAQPTDYFAARRAAVAREREQATASARAEGEAAARAEAEAEAAAKAKADAEAAAKAEAKRAEAAALVRAHHEAKAKQAAAARAKAEAEAAELRCRLEEERKAREELERKAKEDAERAVREAEERVRREVEDRAQREAAERAGREAELREAKARLEAEESGRRQAVEQARREAEALRTTLEAERKAREELEQKAKEDAERRTREQAPHRPPERSDFPTVTTLKLAADEAQAEQATDERAEEVLRRFQAEQAKRDAERQAQHDEAERKRAAAEAELGEEARSAEQAKQKRLREEAEHRSAAEEAERRREEEQARAHAKAVEKAHAAAAAAMRARKQAEEEEAAALATQPWRLEIPAGLRPAEPALRAPRRARSRGRIAAVLFLLVVVGALAAAYFMPLDTAPFEREATARFGTPVKIGSAHLSLLPLPALRFERVSIGPVGEVKIAAVSSRPGVRAIFDKQNALKTLELEGVQIPASWVGAAIWGKGRGDAWRVEHVIARGVKVEAPGLELPVLNVEVKLDFGGSLQSLSALTADRKQTFNLTMTDGTATVGISASAFQLPFPGAVQLGALVGSGTLTPSELALGKFDLDAFGGSVKGSARVRWGASWSVEGEFIAASMNPRLATAALVPTGRLEGMGTFSMRAPTPHKLHEAARVDATFTIKNGTLGFVDLTRALQAGNARGGTTLFASLDGNASFAGRTVRLAQLRLAAGLLNAAGDATVDPAQNLIGRLQVNLTSQARGVLTLSGTVAEPHVKR